MKKGFTIVEVMIVFAILGLICAIAIPEILRRQAEKDDMYGDSAIVESVEKKIPVKETQNNNGTSLKRILGTGRNDPDMYVYELNLEDGTKCVIVKEWNDAIGVSCNWSNNGT